MLPVEKHRTVGTPLGDLRRVQRNRVARRPQRRKVEIAWDRSLGEFVTADEPSDFGVGVPFAISQSS